MPTEKLLLPSQVMKELGIGDNGLISAVKKRLGITRRRVFMSEIVTFLKKNPSFKTSDVYPRKTNVEHQ